MEENLWKHKTFKTRLFPTPKALSFSFKLGKLLNTLFPLCCFCFSPGFLHALIFLYLSKANSNLGMKKLRLKNFVTWCSVGSWLESFAATFRFNILWWARDRTGGEGYVNWSISVLNSKVTFSFGAGRLKVWRDKMLLFNIRSSWTWQWSLKVFEIETILKVSWKFGH